LRVEEISQPIVVPLVTYGENREIVRCLLSSVEDVFHWGFIATYLIHLRTALECAVCSPCWEMQSMQRVAKARLWPSLWTWQQRTSNNVVLNVFLIGYGAVAGSYMLIERTEALLFIRSTVVELEML
jgi:hypothetical protein